MTLSGPFVFQSKISIFYHIIFFLFNVSLSDAVSSQVLEFSTQGFPDCNTVNLDWNAPEEGSVDTYHVCNTLFYLL